MLKELTSGEYTPDHVTTYTYDARGLLTEVYSGGTKTYKSAGYNRDGYGIYVETTEDGELLASYVSRADGLLEQVTDAAGNVTKYQYNQKKQVIGLTITAADGSVLYRENNTYNRNGSLIAQTISGEGYDSENLTYTYDALDRLLSETKNGATTSYTYDSMGNRLTKTEGGITTSYVYDLCNKLLSETTSGVETTYAYDALGNLTEKVSSEGTTTYAYDAMNQLEEVVNPDGTWQRNTYDASGIRSMIAENGVTTEFMFFNGLVLGGYNKNGEQTEHYYYGNSLLTAEYTEYTTDSYGEVTAEISLYYYLKNSHGDVIGFTDSNGTLAETYRYDAFGTLANIQSLNENGVMAEAETALSRFLYAGEQYDSISGLYYLRARYCDTTVGRFTQEDVNLGDGRNLYTYVSNNPLKYTDPSGYEKKQERVNNGLLNVVSGIGMAVTGAAAAIVATTLAVTATVAAAPVLAVAGTVTMLATAALGTGMAVMGVSDAAQGTQEIYNAYTGNPNSAPNLVRDTVFKGNQEAYNQSKTVVSVGTTVGLSAISTLPLVMATGASGAISYYANLDTSGSGSGKSGSKTIHNDILDSPRTGSALTIDEVKPIYKINENTGKPQIIKEFPATAQAHGFNNMVDNYAGYATKTPLNNATLYQLDGSLNGVEGRFEWIIQDGNVTHRMFIQNGTMNGVPIKP